MKFAEELRKYREKNGMSQAELAKNLGVSAQLMGLYEVSGKVPNAFLAVRIARLLGTTVENLFGGEMK